MDRPFSIDWDCINLQDEVELANTRLIQLQADRLEQGKQGRLWMNRIDPFPEAAVGEKQLAATNRFSRRKLSPMGVCLCGQPLRQRGWTGMSGCPPRLGGYPFDARSKTIFDHNPRGAGQTARIFTRR